MNTSDTVARHAPPTRLSSLAGAVFLPRDDGYDEARRRGTSPSTSGLPMVVFAESADDVVRAVRFARAQGCASHRRAPATAPPPLEPLEDAMLLKTSRMRHVDVDPARPAPHAPKRAPNGRT